MPKATKLTTVLILLGAVLAAVLYRYGREQAWPRP